MFTPKCHKVKWCHSEHTTQHNIKCKINYFCWPTLWQRCKSSIEEAEEEENHICRMTHLRLPIKRIGEILQWRDRNVALKEERHIVLGLNGETVKGVSCGLVYLRVVVRVRARGSALHFQSWKELIYGRPMSRGEIRVDVPTASRFLWTAIRTVPMAEKCYFEEITAQSVSSCLIST